MNLGDRMKEYYEGRNQTTLLRKMPVIMRLDGRAFHTFTKQFQRPFDEALSGMMLTTALSLCAEIQGAKCAYIQSDEISILITDMDRIETEAWFDYNVQKMCSISAATATIAFATEYMHWNIGINNSDLLVKMRKISFDSRVFNIPHDEVENYFVWRQKDWERNSIHMLAQAHFSHKQLHKKSRSDMHEMLFQKGINWADLPDKWKNGVFVSKGEFIWSAKPICPIFTEEKSRQLLRSYLCPIEPSEEEEAV